MKAFLLCFFSLLYFTNSLEAQTDAYEPIRGICIYIDYPDAPAQIPEQQLDSLLNGVQYTEPGVNRTFRNYWLQESRRNLDITHDIFFYTAPQTAQYYSTIGWLESIGTWRDALEDVIAKNPNYDWSQLDKHPNGTLKEVMIISSSHLPAGVGGAHYQYWPLSNGVITLGIHGSFIKYPGQSTNNLFIICHEAAHAIYGIPDTYDTQVVSSGTGAYSLMSGQGPDVPPIGGPFLAIHEWGHAIEIEEPGEHTITLGADGDSVFVFRNLHDQAEFFTIEARKNTTLGNSLFPEPIGLLLWHTDDNVTTSNTMYQMTEAQHYRHSIEQADGLFQLESAPGLPTDSRDLYIPGREFTDSTIPSSKWWTNEPSGFELKDIEILGTDKIQFTVTIPEKHETHYEKIPSDDWLLLESTSFAQGYGPEKAYDNDVSTYYHVSGFPNEPRPHELTVYLGDEYLISEVYYQANDNFSPPWEGRVKDYYVSISTDGYDFVPISIGELKRSMYEQYIGFEPELASYIKFSAVTTHGNDGRTSIAELSVRGIRSDMVSTEQAYQNSFLNVFPNPVNDLLNIETQYGVESEVNIYDLNGKVMVTKTINGKAMIDVSYLPYGVYTVISKSGDTVQQTKFVKA